MEIFDVIVIGGSVAGAPTAMLLARLGHHVLLIDKSVFPRDINSTHFIWPRGISYLNRWGLADGILDAAPHYHNLEINIEEISLVGSVPLQDIKQRFINLHGDDHGAIDLYCGPRRYFLDDYLLNSAKQAGADVREGTTYLKPLMEDNTVVGIVAKRADGSLLSAKAKIVIAADGRFSKFANDVGAQYHDYRELSTFAYYGYFSGINRPELAIHKKGRFGTAIFPTLNKTQMALVYGPTANWESFKKDAESNFYKIFHYCAPDIAKLLARGSRTEKFKACGRMQAFQRVSHGPGWALIADACSFKDQVTAMGITHAFRDAELITSFIHRALSNEMNMEHALHLYQEIRAKDYASYFNLVCKTAEMSPYSNEELAHFSSIIGNQHQINKLISEFADTLDIKPHP